MLILYGSTTGSVVPSGLRIIRGQPRNTIQGPNPMTTIIRPAEVWQPMDVSERDFVRVSYEEVLDVGEPRPTMILLVSCPVDLGLGRALQGQRLEVGATIIVSLHAKKQSWPRVGGLPRMAIAAIGLLPLSAPAGVIVKRV